MPPDAPDGMESEGPEDPGETTSTGLPAAVLNPLFGAAWAMPTQPGAGLPNPRRYDVGDEIVVDTVTGLHWQRMLESRNFLTWGAAVDECDGLELAGHDDWRLPSRIELVSLLALDELNPAIDEQAFPETPSDWFWSSTESATDPDAAWYVYFYFGYPNLDRKDNPFSVRCVRSEIDQTQTEPVERFAVQDEELVADVYTGLLWQRHASAETFTFQAAGEYCAELELMGRSDFRAPSMLELQTIVDPAHEAPAIDSETFPGTPAASFWSGTAWIEAPDLRGWHVDFTDGSALYLTATTEFNVRCVTEW